MASDLFNFASPESVTGWSSIDDRVMGGASDSRLRFDRAGHAVFEGTVRLQNNGGFASIRSLAMDFGVAQASSYLLKVNSDGKRYKLNLRMDDGIDGVTYQAAFVTPAGMWTSLRLPIAQFTPTFRGQPVPGAGTLDPARVRQIGLVIADRQVGPFALELRSIHAEQGKPRDSSTRASPPLMPRTNQ